MVLAGIAVALLFFAIGFGGYTIVDRLKAKPKPIDEIPEPEFKQTINEVRTNPTLPLRYLQKPVTKDTLEKLREQKRIDYPRL